MLKMSELAERSGVSAGTIKHYLREGLLGTQEEVVRTSRNMAYYPADYVERVRLIKRLQEKRFMPLRVIREVLASDPERMERMVELEDRIVERAIEARETGRVSRAQVRDTYDVPKNVLDRLEEIGVLTPNGRGYDADDVAIIEAISRFRAGGYEEAIGFTVYDTLRYRDRARAAGAGGGAGAARSADRQGRGRPRGRDHRLGSGAAARSDRRDAFETAARSAAAGSPPHIVSLHHAVPLGQPHAARQLAGESAEGLAVGAAD